MFKVFFPLFFGLVFVGDSTSWPSPLRWAVHASPMRNRLHSDNAANAMHSISGHVNVPLPAATSYRIPDGDHCIRLLFFFVPEELCRAIMG